MDLSSLPCSVNSLELSSPIVSSATVKSPLNPELTTALKRKNVDIKSLADEFYGLYDVDPLLVKRQLVTAIIQCSGIEGYTYGKHFDEANLKDMLSKQDLTCKNAAILEKKFKRQFSTFITALFHLDSGFIFLNDNFFVMLLTIIELLMSGRWDSHRIMASLIGMKLMTSVVYIQERIKDKNSVYKGSYDNKEIEANLYAIWSKLFTEVIRGGLRDRSSSVIYNILDEFIHWSVHYPFALLSDDIKKYVLRSILLKNLQHRRMVYIILFNLSKTSHLKKMLDNKLTEFVTKELVASLNAKGYHGEIAMKILLNVIDWPEFALDKRELELVFMAVYNPNQSIGVQAAKYFFMTQLKNCNSLQILQDLVTFTRESYINNLDMLVDSFSWYFFHHHNWEEWNQLIKTDSSTVVSVTSLLYAVAKRLILNEVPKIRTNLCNKFKEEDRKDIAAVFTNYFKKTWITILSYHSIQINPLALSDIIKILEFFDKEHISSEILLTIWMKLSRICLECPHCTVIDESCRMMVHLQTKFNWSSKEKTIVERQMEKLRENIVNDFMQCLMFPSLLYKDCEVLRGQLCSYAKYFLLKDDLYLWERAIHFLINSSRNVFNNFSGLTKLLMDFLFNIVFRKHQEILALHSQVKAVNGQKSLHKSDDILKEIKSQIYCLEVLLLPRVCELETIFTPLLHIEQQDIRIQTFLNLLKLYELYGPHMAEHEDLHILFINFDNDFIKQMKLFMIDIMNSACEEKKMCCFLLQRFMRLIGEGVFCISNIGDFLVNYGNNSSHDEIVIKSLKFYTKKHKTHFKKLAFTVFYAITVIFEMDISQGVLVQDAVSRGQTVLKRVIESNVATTAAMLFSIYVHIIDKIVEKKDPNMLQLLEPFTHLLSNKSQDDLVKILEEKVPWLTKKEFKLRAF
ncbi:uncharacterized protein LOC106673383 isoform X2 [Cimex lectularius]|uniref:Uncharacterized protein n=1 Tax=Cimex lectularius TaxID=79782 RepID=A0A8I6TL70_CIMLE|nr:uncharacterized protein LOC106673383 isoform X2 [Cimex lectularius]